MFFEHAFVLVGNKAIPKVFMIAPLSGEMIQRHVRLLIAEESYCMAVLVSPIILAIIRYCRSGLLLQERDSMITCVVIEA